MSSLLPNQSDSERCRVHNEVNSSIRNRLACCSYWFAFSKISWQYEDGVLTLHGSVPNFYLKQVVQERLRGIDHVEQIDNDIDVISSYGLSSQRSPQVK